MPSFKRMYVIGILLLVALGGVLSWVRAAYINSPAPGSPVTISIGEGAGLSAVSHELADERVISSALGYRMYGAFHADAKEPKPGAYSLYPGMSYRSIARRLFLGPERREVTLRILEGWTLDDIERTVVKDGGGEASGVLRSVGDGVRGEPFDPLWREEFSFLRSLPSGRSLEGYLFPDTYRVWKDDLPESLIRKQLNEFQDRVDPSSITSFPSPLRSLDDVIVLASIIEKEVRNDEDRKIVAGIFLKRLAIGMPLQSDATLGYVTKSGRSRANERDLQIDSPYNSYRFQGLPPGPICNPSLSSINAVFHPTTSSYYYFLTNREGKVLYASTLEGHILNKRRSGY